MNIMQRLETTAKPKADLILDITAEITINSNKDNKTRYKMKTTQNFQKTT